MVWPKYSKLPVERIPGLWPRPIWLPYCPPLGQSPPSFWQPRMLENCGLRLPVHLSLNPSPLLAVGGRACSLTSLSRCQ